MKTLFLILLFALPLQAQLSTLEQIDVETMAGLREVERYQLKIAEKHYLKGEHKIALAEYEKFLTLYESSAAAPYAQLMWSHTQRKLKKLNTAIREGFQSVIDYWPESSEAVLASYLIADTYQAMGEVEKAEPAFLQTINDHPDEQLAVLSRVRLLEMARTKGDKTKRLALLQDLAFKVKRTEAANEYAVNASRELASILLGEGKLSDAREALATTYENDKLLAELHGLAMDPLQRLFEKEETRDVGQSLADTLIKLLEDAIPIDLTAEGAHEACVARLDRIASVFGRSGRPNEVLNTYERMLKLLGKSDGILGRIANWYRHHEQRDKAREIYRQFDNQIAGLNEIAVMFREEERWKEAIDTFRELIELNPDGTNDYLMAIAECHEAAGELKSAIGVYRQVDRYPLTYFRMASCHRRLKEYSEALTLYRQCKTHTESGPDAFLQIGFTYEEAGKKENAIKAFQLTCKTHPKSHVASKAHSHLQSKYNISVTLGGAKEE